MPIEVTLLEGKPCRLSRCPLCGHVPFEPDFRGMVQRRRFWSFPRTYCAVVCSKCREIVGHESSDGSLFTFARKVTKAQRRMATVAEILGS